jgi:hypothetical protein
MSELDSSIIRDPMKSGEVSRMRSTGGLRAGAVPEVDRVDDRSPGRSHDVAPIGILLLDVNYHPFLPGTPGNVSMPEVPVRCRVVEGCTVDRLIVEGDSELEKPMVAAARKLVDDGARAITGNCGFMIRHQAAVSDAVDVPVLLSSLLFAPLLLAWMGGRSKLGIVTASGASLTQELLDQAGVTDPGRVVVGNLADQPAFRAAALEFTPGKYDRAAMERDGERHQRARREASGYRSSPVRVHGAPALRRGSAAASMTRG